MDGPAEREREQEQREWEQDSDGSARAFAAVDLGASSGRVVVGVVTPAGERPATVRLHEVARFPNRPVSVRGTLHWDVLSLYDGILEGLRAAGRQHGPLAGVGVDSWAVDYGLLDADGALLGNPVHYRDGRTVGMVEQVQATVPADELYRVTGAQTQPFNTIHQLEADRGRLERLPGARLLMIPDLLTYWLTGVARGEVTNASTTQLLDVRRRRWADDVLTLLGLPADLLPELAEPGSVLAPMSDEVLAATGLDGPVPVITVGSHDTASAVVGVPAVDERFAYVSCGTWSLVGLELDAPVLTEASRAANFTNELGVDGTVRYLKNVMGLWLLQECLRTWSEQGEPEDLPTLLQEAAEIPPLAAVLDVDQPQFLPPGDMPSRIAQELVRTGQQVPRTRAGLVRAVLDSLALAHRRAVRTAVALSGRAVDVVHLVGGGVHNDLLCRLTAEATGLPVVAGPVEAAALGNVLVQARAVGVLEGDLSALRTTTVLGEVRRRYEPSGHDADWEQAEARLSG